MTNDGKTLFVKREGTTDSFQTVSYRNRWVRFAASKQQTHKSFRVAHFNLLSLSVKTISVAIRP